MKILHPGGLEATEVLAERCSISENMTILDVGCGRGSTSIFLARKYGCNVVGVDIDQRLLIKAQIDAEKKGFLEKVSFKLADINALPFEDKTFDGVIVQLMLIFTDKLKSLLQLSRKIRSGGFIGVLELAWKRPPTHLVVKRAANAICRVVTNAEEHNGWIYLLRSCGLTVTEAELRNVEFSFSGMLRNEGLFSTLRIVLKSAFDEQTRKKTKEINKLFHDVKDYLGYGIYVGKRDGVDRGFTLHQDT